MNMFIHVVTILGSVSVTLAFGDTSHLCDEISHLDCGTYVPGDTDEKVCDTHHVLHDNFCEYSKAKCADQSLGVATLGQCFDHHPPIVQITSTDLPLNSTTATPTTTTSISTTATSSITAAAATTTTTAAATTTTTAFPTGDPVVELFCRQKDSVTCPPALAPVCASNGRLYFNKCDFSLAYCDDRSLRLMDPSTCHH